MKDQSKTKTQLIEELEALRKQVTKLKRMETKRKRAEEALLKSEEKFRMVADFTYDWEYWLKPDGDFVYVSPSCERITGYRADEFFDNPDLLTTIVHPADYGMISQHISEALKPTYGTCTFDFRIITREGEERWISHHCQPAFSKDGTWLGRRGSNRDITMRKKVEKVLRDSEERLNLAIEGSNGGLWDLEFNPNGPLNTIPDEIYLSPRLKNFIGYENDEFPNSIEAWKSRLVPEDLVLLNNAAKDHLEGRKDIHEAEYRIRHKDGGIRWIHTRGKILSDKGGRAMRWTGIDWDITDRKRSEEKIHIYQEELRSLASELSLIEERERRRIATDLHDYIGQTLAITKMRLGALRELAISGDLSTLVGEIQTLTDQAIQYTRSLTSELSPSVLYELGFKAAMEWLTEQIRDQHHIQVDFEDDRQAKPMSDEIRISLFKAVRELLINIAKHSKAHKAKVSTRREDNIIRVIVEDDGVGFSIPEDKSLTKIGGFGLFSVHERLKYLKGDFEIDSKPGQGTRITLVAPLTKEENNNGSVT